MSKKLTIGLIIFFSIVLIGLLVYFFVFEFNKNNNAGSKDQKTTNNSTNNTNSNTVIPTVTTAAEMGDFASGFRNVFQSWDSLGHCHYLKIADTFDATQLQDFKDTYVANYGITPIEQMDNAYVWCFYDSDLGQSVYDKLTAL